MNKLKIAIDINGTIDENQTTISFFSLLTNLLKENIEIFIITNRDIKLRDRTEELLKKWNIYYNHLVITGNKEKVILENKISIVFEDIDDYILNLPENIVVFKIRNGGNFDFEDFHKWCYTDKTGMKI